MKKAILSLFGLAALFAMSTANATVRTVSNDPNSPGQYTNLQTAINAATAGDTLLVSGSGTAYTSTDASGLFVIAKKLTLLGTGYNPYKDLSSVVSTLGNYIDLQTGCDGTVIQGFVLQHVNFYNNVVNNITIKRNNITGYLIYAYGNGWLISENWFSGGSISINGNNTVAQNNVFTIGNNSQVINNSITNVNTLVINNTIFCTNGATGLFVLNNALVVNNIFYQINGDPNATYGLGSGNLVSNNVVYGNSNTNPFNVGTGLPNAGSNNKLGVDPKFTSLVFDANGNPTVASNFLLLSTSTVKTAGSDGKEPGIYGGSTPAQNPLRGTPAIPQVSSMLLNNVTVAPGGTISVALKAREGN